MTDNMGLDNVKQILASLIVLSFGFLILSLPLYVLTGNPMFVTDITISGIFVVMIISIVSLILIALFE